MNCIDNHLQFLCALRSCSFSYLRILQFARVSEMFPNSACWLQSSSVALCNAYRMRCCECQYNFHLSTRPPTEGERESTYYTIYRILWFHGCLPVWNSPPSSLCIRLFEFFKPPKNKATKNRQWGPKRSRLPCSGSRYRQNIWMRSEAFVCRGSLGAEGT